MKITKKETLHLTEEEYHILDEAREILEKIYLAADIEGDIRKASCNATESICDLLQDENCELM